MEGVGGARPLAQVTFACSSRLRPLLVQLIMGHAPPVSYRLYWGRRVPVQLTVRGVLGCDLNAHRSSISVVLPRVRIIRLYSAWICGSHTLVPNQAPQIVWIGHHNANKPHSGIQEDKLGLQKRVAPYLRSIPLTRVRGLPEPIAREDNLNLDRGTAAPLCGQTNSPRKDRTTEWEGHPQRVRSLRRDPTVA